MSTVGGLGRTPSPSRTRLVAVTLFALGLGLSFVGIFVSRQVLSGEYTGFAALATAVGALAALAPGERFCVRSAAGLLTRRRVSLAALG